MMTAMKRMIVVLQNYCKKESMIYKNNLFKSEILQNDMHEITKTILVNCYTNLHNKSLFEKEKKKINTLT